MWPRSERPLRVVITNTGPLNGGDAAILHAVLSVLRGALGADTELTVYGSHAEEAARRYPDIRFRSHVHELVPRGRSRLGGRATQLLHQAALWRMIAAAWLAARRLGPLALWALPEAQRQAVRDYARADLVVSNGGTYLVENYRLESRIFDYRLACAARRPPLLFTQSLGPFERPAYRRPLRRLLRRSPLILLRDERSREHLRELGVPLARAHVLPDAAFALAPEQPPAARPRPAGAPRVAVSVREWRFFRDGSAPAQGMERYRAAVAGLVTRLVRERGAQVVFLSTCQGTESYGYDDSATAAEITALLPSEVRGSVEVDRGFHTPQELIALAGGFDLVVSTRMHMAILSLCAGVPVLPIAYEFKTRELAAKLGFGEAVCEIEEASAERLAASAFALLDGAERLRPELARRVQAERGGALTAGALVAAVLSGGGRRPAQAAAPAPGLEPSLP